MARQWTQSDNDKILTNNAPNHNNKKWNNQKHDNKMTIQ